MAKKVKKKEIDFDEVVSDSVSGDLGSKELPLKKHPFNAVFTVSLAIASVVLLRTFILGGAEHDRYLSLALGNVNEESAISAPRGLITDRNGKALVLNEPIFSVYIRVPIMVKNGEETKVMNFLQNVLSLRPEEFLQRIGETNLENASDVLIARDISLKQAIDLKSATFESLRVNDEYRRHYLSDAFSAVTGFVGYSEKDRLLSGRAGIEAYYDDILRGEDGKRITYRDALGRTKSAEAVKEPKQDSPVKTTIDYDFQEYFYGRLLRGLNSLGRTGGVGLALNPQNGEVLALLSFPSFDANNVSKYLNDSGRPLFNRVVGGVYTPGSTIKPVHAVAALKEGVITPQGKIFSAGYIEIPNPYNPETPSRFLDWKPHGLVDSHSALARSSNVYFYEVIGGFGGLKGVGVDKLKDYWQKFGFGRLAGIDLPGEASGFLPDPEEKEKRTGSPWRVGDTYNVAIGQGDISMTPLQLMDAIVAIANGGKTFAPHIKLDSGNSPPKIIFDVSELEPELKEVRVGMEDAVSKPYGTANLLSSLPFTVAAKTGSSQTANNTKTNALFVGYAPTENPQIAILVLIEDAKEGSLNAVPIANDVLRWYYENRIRSNVNK